MTNPQEASPDLQEALKTLKVLKIPSTGPIRLERTLLSEEEMSPQEREEMRQEVINTFGHGKFKQKDVEYLINMYGLEDTQIIGGAIDDIYFPVFDKNKEFRKNRTHYFDNLTHKQIQLLKNKDTREKLGEFVREHRRKTGSILTVRRIIKGWHHLMDQYCKEGWEKEWEDKLKGEQTRKEQEYEAQIQAQQEKEKQTRLAEEEKERQTILAEEERQKALATLADSRKSYEEANETTKNIMVEKREGIFNRGIDARTDPNRIMTTKQIQNILSTYGQDNMLKLSQIITTVYTQDFKRPKGDTKYDLLMNPILSQDELNAIDEQAMKTFKRIVSISDTFIPLKTLVKDKETLCKTLGISAS